MDIEHEFVDVMKVPRLKRRHHRDRLKRKRRYHWGHDRDLSLEPEILARAVNTPTPCSCWMCRNNREKTRKERESELLLIEGLELLKDGDNE